MKKGYIYLAFAAIIFSSFEVVSKLISGMEAIQINFFRFLIGGAAILPFAFREMTKRRVSVKKEDLLTIMGLGVLLVPGGMVLLQIGIQQLPASLSSFVFSTNPVMIAIFAYLILKERPNIYIVLAIVSGLTGLAVLSNPFNSSVNWSVIYVIIAALLFAFYAVSMRKLNLKYGNLIPYTISALSGTGVLFLLLLIMDIPIIKGLTLQNIPPLVYIGLFCSGIGYISYFKGMELTSTNVGSVVFFSKPVFSTILAVVVLNEIITGRFLAGATLVIVSSILMFYGKERG